MKQKLLYLGIAVMSLLVTTAIVGGATYAFSGEGTPWRQQADPEQRAAMAEQREAIDEAIANNDYQAWVEAVGENCPMLEQINADNFARFAEAQKLRQAGDCDGAQAIMKELGLEQPMSGGRMGGPRGVGKGEGFWPGPDGEKMSAIKEAIANNDYNAWLVVVGADSKMAEKVTAENFSQLVEVYQLKEAGEHEAARELAEESGLGQGNGFFGHGHKFGRPCCEGDDCPPRPEAMP